MANTGCDCEYVDVLESGPPLRVYESPTCEIHGQPCSCKGCWACKGKAPGCTCDVDWDEVYGHNK